MIIAFMYRPSSWQCGCRFVGGALAQATIQATAGGRRRGRLHARDVQGRQYLAGSCGHNARTPGRARGLGSQFRATSPLRAGIV
jgi:hypothetical protein